MIKKELIKKLRKFVAVFDYIDQVLIALNATTGAVSSCSFTSIVGAPVGIVEIFSCVYIKCFTSAKKNTKNMKLKLLAKEYTFG